MTSAAEHWYNTLIRSQKFSMAIHYCNRYEVDITMYHPDKITIDRIEELYSHSKQRLQCDC